MHLNIAFTLSYCSFSAFLCTCSKNHFIILLLFSCFIITRVVLDVLYIVIFVLTEMCCF